jgi:hypothetical protein
MPVEHSAVATKKQLLLRGALQLHLVSICQPNDEDVFPCRIQQSRAEPTRGFEGWKYETLIPPQTKQY